MRYDLYYKAHFYLCKTKTHNKTAIYNLFQNILEIIMQNVYN